MRISKYVAHCGVCSRRKAEEAVAAGRVCIGGEVVTQLGTQVGQGDVVTLDGVRITPQEEYVYIMLYKPEGYITTTSDEKGRPCVLDLVKDPGVRLVPVGRLDCATSGLLLLTNDGHFVNRMTHPRYSPPKTYKVRIDGRIGEEALEAMRNGMLVDGYLTRPARVRLLQSRGDTSLLEVVLREGRNRQIRKMLGQLGHVVLALKRESVGSLRLEGLKKGQYRHLEPEELRELNGQEDGP